MHKEIIGDCTLYLGDCLEVLPTLGQFDAVIADPPYGTTACPWDSVIDIPQMWAGLRLVSQKGTPIVLSATQPFSSVLVSSNILNFKYEWIYEKTNPKGFLSAKKKPLTSHENVLVFCSGSAPYFPQKWKIPEYLRTKRKHATSHTTGECYGGSKIKRWNDDGERFPSSVIGFSNRVGRKENYHPTQKPLSLFEYLIKTYTLTRESVLDFSMGSGTTGVACVNLNRKFTGIELEPKYFDIACKRIEQAYKTKPRLFDTIKEKPKQMSII